MKPPKTQQELRTSEVDRLLALYMQEIQQLPAPAQSATLNAIISEKHLTIQELAALNEWGVLSNTLNIRYLCIDPTHFTTHVTSSHAKETKKYVADRISALKTSDEPATIPNLNTTSLTNLTLAMGSYLTDSISHSNNDIIRTSVTHGMKGAMIGFWKNSDLTEAITGFLSGAIGGTVIKTVKTSGKDPYIAKKAIGSFINNLSKRIRSDKTSEIIASTIISAATSAGLASIIPKSKGTSAATIISKLPDIAAIGMSELYLTADPMKAASKMLAKYIYNYAAKKISENSDIDPIIANTALANASKELAAAISAIVMTQIYSYLGHSLKSDHPTAQEEALINATLLALYGAIKTNEALYSSEFANSTISHNDIKIAGLGAAASHHLSDHLSINNSAHSLPEHQAISSPELTITQKGQSTLFDGLLFATVIAGAANIVSKLSKSMKNPSEVAMEVKLAILTQRFKKLILPDETDAGRIKNENLQKLIAEVDNLSSDLNSFNKTKKNSSPEKILKQQATAILHKYEALCKKAEQLEDKRKSKSWIR